MTKIRDLLGVLRWRAGRWLRPVRTRVVKRAVQPGAALHVYWKKEELGQGPCASLYIGNSEVLRFDCFGENGHYHRHVREQEKRGQVERIDFGTSSVEAQVVRSCDELLQARDHLRSSSQARIRDFCLDPKGLEKAVGWARQQMNALRKNEALGK